MENEWVIFSGGDFTPSQLTQRVLARVNPSNIIAADSGADNARRIGVCPSIVIGDLDSITNDTKAWLEANNTKFPILLTTLESIPEGQDGPNDASEKDQIDLEMAVDYAIEQGARNITVLGGLYGRRIDLAIANIHFAVRRGVAVQFVDGNVSVLGAKGPNKIAIKDGYKNDLVSLRPLSDNGVMGITTEGLKFPLKNATLYPDRTRGESNRLLGKAGSVKFRRGILLVTHFTHEQEG